MGFIFFLLLVQSLVMGFFCGYIADQKNREYWSWFTLGFFFSFLALLALIAVPKIEKNERPRAVYNNHQAPQPQAQRPAAERKCPFCAEQIKLEAKICRFCQRDVSSAERRPQIALSTTAAAKPPPETQFKAVSVFGGVTFSKFDPQGREVNVKNIHFAKAAITSAGYKIEFLDAGNSSYYCITAQGSEGKIYLENGENLIGFAATLDQVQG